VVKETNQETYAVEGEEAEVKELRKFTVLFNTVNHKQGLQAFLD